MTGVLRVGSYSAGSAAETQLRLLAAGLQGGLWIPPARPVRHPLAGWVHEPHTRHGFMMFGAG